MRSQLPHTFYFCVFLLPKEPDNKEMQVQNVRVGSFLEDEKSNTFSVNFTWEPPPFKYSTVRSYIVSYELHGGYLRENLSCSPLQRDSRRLGCSKSGDVSLDEISVCNGLNGQFLSPSPKWQTVRHWLVINIRKKVVMRIRIFSSSLRHSDNNTIIACRILPCAFI